MIARSPFQDYRAPAFYMVTITTHKRRAHFAVCANNRSKLTPDGLFMTFGIASLKITPK